VVISYDRYLSELRSHLWRYRQDVFGQSDDYFDLPMSTDHGRMPVFRRQHADKNVLLRLGDSAREQDGVLGTLSRDKRHRHFASMRSSQALAQSVFGNLKAHKSLDCLLDLRDGNGPLFPVVDADLVSMEHEIEHLGEQQRARTSVDVMFCGGYRVAVECKLAEDDIGCCSRPKLKRDDPEWCDGDYKYQMERSDRCALSARGIRYWAFVPELTSWTAESDHIPCPLHRTYQLARNLLAACIRPNNDVPTVDPGHGHVVLIANERNPAFQEGGQGHEAVQAAREGLRDPTRLRVCSWQQVIAAMRKDPHLAWLTDGLHLKYGF